MNKKKSSFWVQAGIFTAILLVADIISKLLKPYFPAPTAVVGMVILFFLLCLKVVKLEQVEELGDSLISKIGILFVPSGVSIIAHWDLMAKYGLQISVVIAITTIVLLTGTAWFAQTFLGKNSIKNIEVLEQEIQRERGGA